MNPECSGETVNYAKYKVYNLVYWLSRDFEDWHKSYKYAIYIISSCTTEKKQTNNIKYTNKN